MAAQRQAGYTVMAGEPRTLAITVMDGAAARLFVHRPPAGEWVLEGRPGESPLVGLLNAACDDALPAWAATWGQSWPVPDEQCEPLPDVMRMVCRASGFGDPEDGPADSEGRFAQVQRFRELLIEALPVAWGDAVRLSLELDMFPVDLIAEAGEAALRLDWDATCEALMETAFWCLLEDFRVENKAFASLRATLDDRALTPDQWRGLTAPQRFALIPDLPPLSCLSLRAADDADKLASLGGLAVVTVTDSLPALVWQEIIWAIRNDFKLRACGRPDCERFFLTAGGQWAYCASHSTSAPQKVPQEMRGAWKRYVQRNRDNPDRADFETWARGYGSRRRKRNGPSKHR